MDPMLSGIRTHATRGVAAQNESFETWKLPEQLLGLGILQEWMLVVVEMCIRMCNHQSNFSYRPAIAVSTAKQRF